MNKKAKKLNKLNNDLDKLINKENQEVFTNMICYLRGADISDYHQELVRQDLTEMILSAQNRGENIYSVIGDDFKVFCDNIIASLPPKTRKQKMVDFFIFFCWVLSILGSITVITANETFALIYNFFTGNALQFHISVSIGTAISMGMILIASVIIVEIIAKNSFQTLEPKNLILKGFIGGASIMAVFLLIAWLGKEVLFTVNIFIALATIFCLYSIHKLLEQI